MKMKSKVGSVYFEDKMFLYRIKKAFESKNQKAHIKLGCHKK